MKAIVLEKFGAPESLVFKEVEKPAPEQGFALIRVMAFGLNHAEMHMRKGEWAEWMPIIGVECVGVVEACPGGEFAPGTPVAAAMGGLGRTINGSYAEYTNARVSCVISLGSAGPPLPWDQLAALPVTYCTAWSCLFRNLEIQPHQTLLIRGATSALGKAAINLAVAQGVKVTATTRNMARKKELEDMGVTRVEKEAYGFDKQLDLKFEDKFDACLNLVGNSVLLETLPLVRRGGRLCHAGWLGGLAPISEFNPLLQMPSDVHLSLFASPHFGTPGFPLNDVPLAEIVKMVADGRFNAAPWRVFKFEQIHEAHGIIDADSARGKIVVMVV